MKLAALENRLNGKRLLGEIEISDLEYLELLQYSKRRVISLNNYSWSQSDLLLSVTLIQIGMREFRQGNYWDNFFLTLNLKEHQNKQRFISSIFLNTLDKYDLYKYEVSSNRAQNVQNILIHCMVPDSYYNQFCDFLFAFYELNLQRYYDESNIIDEIENIAINIQSTLSNNTDVLNIEDRSKCKTYMLLKSTRIAMAEINELLYFDLIIDLIKKIDLFYYDDILPEPNSRADNNFINWARTIENHIMIKEQKNGKKRTIVNSRPYYRIDFSNKFLEVIVPEQKIRVDEYDGGMYFVANSKNYRLNANKKGINVIYSDEFILRDNNLNPFNDNEWTLKFLKVKNISIETDKYLIFNSEGNQIKKFSHGKNYILVDNDIDINYDNKCKIYENGILNGFRLFIAEVEEDFCIYINGCPISKNGTFKEGIQATKKENVIAYSLLSGEEIIVYKEHPILNFKIRKELFNGTILIINQNKYRLSDFNNLEKFIIKSDEAITGISLNLDGRVNNIDDFYSIYIDSPGCSLQKVCSYLLLNETRFWFSKKRFLDTDIISLCFLSKLTFNPKNCINTYRDRFVLKKYFDVFSFCLTDLI